MKPLHLIVMIFLLAIALMHLLRLGFQFEVMVAGEVIPLWLSLCGFVIALVLAGLLWRDRRK